MHNAITNGMTLQRTMQAPTRSLVFPLFTWSRPTVLVNGSSDWQQVTACHVATTLLSHDFNSASN
jgi:hypothetical protein